MKNNNYQTYEDIILSNLHGITTEILNHYDFGETDDLEEFAIPYCEKYIEVYNLIQSTYANVNKQETKISIDVLPPKG